MNMQVTPMQDIEQMQQLLTTQRKAYRAMPMPTKKQRIDHLNGLKTALLKYSEKLADAVNEDFSCRSKDETTIAEVIPAVNAIKYTIKQLGQWMKPSKRHLDIAMQPARAYVMYQPLGVVGIIVPWNYPIAMTLQPLICALGAGNRAMLKLSEFTPKTNEVLRAMLADAFAEDHVAVVTGEADVAAAFSSLPFGGIGNSGMGHYHGWEGFETLSKTKSVLAKGKFNAAKSVYAPYGQTFHKIFYWLNLR